MSFFTVAWDLCGTKGCETGGESLNRSSIPVPDRTLFSAGFALAVVPSFFSALVVAPDAAFLRRSLSVGQKQ